MEGVKHEMENLVGMFSKHPDAKLHTSEAYDAAYKVLFDTLVYGGVS
jgi:hypothetical protein